VCLYVASGQSSKAYFGQGLPLLLPRSLKRVCSFCRLLTGLLELGAQDTVPDFVVWNTERVETDTFSVGSELGAHCFSAAFHSHNQLRHHGTRKFYGHLRLFCDHVFDAQQFIDLQCRSNRFVSV
jgi:hypothetical protein